MAINFMNNELVDLVNENKNNKLENFDSFVVTNPDLVDEGIDVSGLRTTTDISPYLLGNIPDYGGIQYEAYNPNRLSDLMRLYSGGFPMLDTGTAQIPGAIDTLVDAGGGGGGMDQATSGLDTTQPFQDLVDPNVNIDEFANEDTTMPSNLTSDMVGNIDTTPVDTYTSPTSNVAPDGTTMAGVEGYLDGINLDNTFAGTPVNTPSGNNPFGYEDPQSLAIGPSGAVDFNTGGLDDIGQAVGEEFADTPVSTPSGNNPFGYEDPQSLAIGPSGAVNFNTGGLDDIGADIGVDNTVDYGMPQGSPGQLNPASPSIDNITTGVTTPSSFDYETEAYGTVNEVTEDPTMQETISNAFTSAKQGIGDLATASVDKIQEVGQSIANTIGGIYNGVDQTISVFGREINVPATLAGISLGQAINFPVTLAFGVTKAIGGALPTGVSSIEYNSYNDSQKGAIDNAYGPGGVMDGYNAVSAFGKGPLATVTERLENRTSKGIFDSTTDKLNDLSAKLGGITVTAPAYDFDDTTTTTTTPSGNTVDVETGDITNDVGVTVSNINDEFGEGVATEQAAADVEASNAASINLGQSLHGGPEGTTGGTTGGAAPGTGAQGPAGGATADDGFGGYEQGAFADDATGSDTSPGATGGEGGFDDNSFSDANTGFDTSPGATGGEGGGGNGGGKIVCTMMNDSYGFGSFRNKIWLKHSKDLAPEYQIGYHKIFLPLVKLSKTNKVVKKVLEHIAVHRTIDIRQESRGKTHLLGRVYRKILEPICYIVGKYAK